MARIYAMYKGDEFLGIGTRKELAELFNCSVKYITWLGTPSCRKRIERFSKNGRQSKHKLVIRIEDSDE